MQFWLIKVKKVLFLQRDNHGSLAQLVQSTCLTSRGSLVRIQQFPQNMEDNPLIFSGFFFFLFLDLPLRLFFRKNTIFADQISRLAINKGWDEEIERADAIKTLTPKCA